MDPGVIVGMSWVLIQESLQDLEPLVQGEESLSLFLEQFTLLSSVLGATLLFSSFRVEIALLFF